MKATDFQQKYPKPWKFVVFGMSASLRAANGTVIASMNLSANHKGTPQQEWNRHVAAALREYLPVESDPTSDSVRCSLHS